MSQAFAVLGRLFSGWGEASPLVTPAARRHRRRHHRRPVRARRCASTGCRRRSPASGPRCRSACSASPCSASPPSVRSASRPSSTTGSDDRRPHTAAPRRLGVARGVRSRTRTPSWRRPTTAGCGPRGRACWPSAPPPSPVVPALRAHPPAQRPGVAGRHAPHGQPRPDRPGGRAQPRPAALAHRLGHGPRATACPGGHGRASRRRGRGPPPPGGPRPGPDRPEHGGPAPTTPTTVPPNPKLPTAANPLRVLIVGDSIGLDMGGAAAVRPGRHRRRQRRARRPREHGADPARLLQLAGGADGGPQDGAAPGGRRHDRRQRRPGLPRAPRRALHLAPVEHALRPAGGAVHADRGERRRHGGVGRHAAHAEPGPQRADVRRQRRGPAAGGARHTRP